MGAGDQGGSSSAEDGEIRKAFSADPNATAKDARDFFRDRDSGKLAARSYLDSRPTDRTMSDGSPMDDTFAEIIDGRLGNIGVTRNDTGFVNADGKTVGGINPAGNFFGGREVINALRGTPSLTDMRQAASREAKFGPGSRAAQEGDINTSLLDLVDYAEDGTVQGMGPNRFMDERGRGQLVYDPSAVIPGLPYLQDPQNKEFVPQYDPSRESLLGRGLQGAADYVGDGGMLGVVGRGLDGLADRMGAVTGGFFADENMNPENFSPTRPVLRPTDGSITENDGITSAGIRNAIMGGAGSVNKLTSDQLRNFPQYASNAFLSSAQRGEQNPFINPAPEFNAQGVQVPFDGGNRIGVPLGIGTLSGKKTLSELAKTEPVITAGFRNPTNVFDPRQRIIDDALAPLGDRVSMYEDDPSIAFGFGGEPFDLSQTSGFTDNQRRFDRGLAPTNISDPQSEVTYIDPTDAYQTPFQRDFTYLGGKDGLLPRRSTSEINRIGVPTQIAPYDASFEREDAVRALPDQTFGSLFADQRAADAARDFASGEGSTGAQISETPAYSDDADRLEDLITTAAVQASPSQPYGSLFADQRAAQAARDFASGEGSTFGQMSGTPAFGSSVPNTIQVSPNADQITDTPTLAFQDENFGRDSDVTDFSFENRTPINRMMYNRPTPEVSEGDGPMSIGDAFKYIGGDLKRIFNEDPAVVARREAAELDERNRFGLEDLYDPSGANNMTMTDALKYIGGDIGNIFKESYNNAQTGVNESIPVSPSFSTISRTANTDNQFVPPASPVQSSSVSASQNGFNPAGIGAPVENSIEAVIVDARAKRLGKLGTATGGENNRPLEDPSEYIDPRIQDAMAPDGLDDNMYNDGSEIFDLSETYDPSGGGFTDGGGGGGGFGGCPEGYEPMTSENGETVCVPIEEEVIEEVAEEEVQETPVIPTVRPTMRPSAYTPQAVSPIRPYTLQPSEQGVGSLADVLQLQNFPIIV